MLTIELIQSLCHQGKIQWTNYVMQRLIKRNISREDVKNAIASGKVIEYYPDDFPYPSCLILSLALKSGPLHIVCGVGDGILWIITAYRPDPLQWDDTFSHRKE